MSTPVESFLLQCVAQQGDVYRFGAEADFRDPNPAAWDCSELIEWAAATSSPPVEPKVPDGSWLQWRHCALHQRTISVVEGVMRRGALLFIFSGDPATGGRPRAAHCALSLGDGSTVEARGTKWGVGSWTSDPAVRHWTHAAELPGVDYHSLTPSFRTLRLTMPFMRGVDVAYVQTALNLVQPVYHAPLVVDGIYGRMTERDVRDWQSRRGLRSDGIFGPRSWAAIG